MSKLNPERSRSQEENADYNLGPMKNSGSPIRRKRRAMTVSPRRARDRQNRYKKDRPPSFSATRSKFSTCLLPLPPPPPPPPVSVETFCTNTSIVPTEMRRAISEPCAIKRFCFNEEIKLSTAIQVQNASLDYSDTATSDDFSPSKTATENEYKQTSNVSRIFRAADNYNIDNLDSSASLKTSAIAGINLNSVEDFKVDERIPIPDRCEDNAVSPANDSNQIKYSKKQKPKLYLEQIFQENFNQIDVSPNGREQTNTSLSEGIIMPHHSECNEKSLLAFLNQSSGKTTTKGTGNDQASFLREIDGLETDPLTRGSYVIDSRQNFVPLSDNYLSSVPTLTCTDKTMKPRCSEDNNLESSSILKQDEGRAMTEHGHSKRITGKCTLVLLITTSLIAVVCAVLFGLSFSGILMAPKLSNEPYIGEEIVTTDTISLKTTELAINEQRKTAPTTSMQQTTAILLPEQKTQEDTFTFGSDENVGTISSIEDVSTNSIKIRNKYTTTPMRVQDTTKEDEYMNTQNRGTPVGPNSSSAAQTTNSSLVETGNSGNLTESTTNNDALTPTAKTKRAKSTTENSRKKKRNRGKKRRMDSTERQNSRAVRNKNGSNSKTTRTNNNQNRGQKMALSSGESENEDTDTNTPKNSHLKLEVSPRRKHLTKYNDNSRIMNDESFRISIEEGDTRSTGVDRFYISDNIANVAKRPLLESRSSGSIATADTNSVKGNKGTTEVNVEKFVNTDNIQSSFNVDEERSCMRISNPKCEMFLPYKFTSFVTKNEEADKKLNKVYRRMLQALGVALHSSHPLEKKSSLEKSSTKSLLFARRGPTTIPRIGCDVKKALRVICHVRFPPCDDAFWNMTTDYNSDEEYSQSDDVCHNWCIDSLQNCFDVDTYIILKKMYQTDSKFTHTLKDNMLAYEDISTELGSLKNEFSGILNGLGNIEMGNFADPTTTSLRSTRNNRLWTGDICKHLYKNDERIMKNLECSLMSIRNKVTREPEKETIDKGISKTIAMDVECGEEYFQCKIGTCLDWNWTCDGQNDCGEFEDEIGCECSENQFHCDNGQCIDSESKCDGYHDCLDKSDERNCSFCSPGLYNCKRTNQCISTTWICDGDVDCFNGEDEKYCSCESRGMIQCGSENVCIPTHYKCDGDIDCRDESDERTCENRKQRCGVYELLCGDLCVPLSSTCDGIRDCERGEDEENCGYCEAVQLEACKETSYNVTLLPNFLSHRSQIKTATSSEYVLFSAIIHTRCHPLLRQLGCSILAPSPIIKNSRHNHCAINSTSIPTYILPRLLPCREFCETIRSHCSSILASVSMTWPAFLSCKDLPSEKEKKCLDFEMIANALCSSDEFQCPNSKSPLSACLPLTAKCDGIQHCEDGSDELSCDCDKLGRFTCGTGQCIPHKWRCDGHIDCPNAFDESRCGNCTTREKVCNDYSCIKSDKWCDGIKDCADGSDEEKCVKLVPRQHAKRMVHDIFYDSIDWSTHEPSGILIGWRGGRWAPVCEDGWTSMLSHLACKQMKFSEALPVSNTHLGNKISYSINVHEYRRAKLVQLTFIGRLMPCRSNRAVQLRCKPAICGKRLNSGSGVDEVLPRIFGGRTAKIKSWPWIASMSLPGMRHVCGATLFHNQWLVSAAHCFHGRNDAKFWNAKFRTSTIGNVKNTPMIYVNVTQIILHPRFDATSMDFDIALIKLQRSILKHEGPVAACIPEVSPKRGAYCYIAGWGVTGKSARGSRKLQEGAVHVTNRVECQEYYPKHIITNRMICAGHQFGSVDACNGDSGGPMTCWQPKLRQWHLAGVTSWGSACMPHGAPGVYTDIAYFSKWIRNAIGGG